MSIQKLDKYQLHEELGRGGYGTVYRATDTVLDVPRAVKLLHPALVADPSFIERFRREAKFAARMKHPHIVPVYDLGEAEGRFFLAMEYLPSGSLKDLLNNEGALNFQRALAILEQVAGALDHIHQQGLIHRDVKPGNILFDDQGNAYLSDLGFAKALSSSGSASLSVSGGMIGTPAYMAPEIWMGEEASPQSDVYSLATVFVEMLTGQSLFGGEGDSPPPLVMKRHFDPLELPEEWPEDVSPGLNSILEAALAKDPKERTASPGEFKTALHNLMIVKEDELIPETQVVTSLTGDTEAHLPDTPKPVTGKSPHLIPDNKNPASSLLGRWPLWAGLGAVVLAGLCGLIIFILTWPPEIETVVETVVVEVTSTLAEIVFQPAVSQTHLPETPFPTLLNSKTPLPALQTITPTTAPTLPNTYTPLPTLQAITPTVALLGVGSTQRSDVDGMLQVYVPAGKFEMGSEDGSSDESPLHTVYLDAFWIDQTEVTLGQFEAFIRVDNYDANPCGEGENHPVACVSWFDAQAYCEWAGRRLPTEAEWEKAARGGLEGATYPWGDHSLTCDHAAENGAQYRDCYGRTAPVGSFSPNGYGLYDMVGNVWEWVSTLYMAYPYDAADGREDVDASGYRVLRGGTWDSVVGGRYLRIAYRLRALPHDGNDGIGFRCATGATP
jgi:eukaryotic-like serine/threonine-protein kinase